MSDELSKDYLKENLENQEKSRGFIENPDILDAESTISKQNKELSIKDSIKLYELQEQREQRRFLNKLTISKFIANTILGTILLISGTVLALNDKDIGVYLLGFGSAALGINTGKEIKNLKKDD